MSIPTAAPRGTAPRSASGGGVALLVVAAGRGTRAGGGLGTPKQYRSIGGRPVIAETLAGIGRHPSFARVVVVIHPDDAEAFEAAAGGLDVEAVAGGAERQASVRAGLEHLAAADVAPDSVLIHDAVRPFCPAAVVERVIARLAESDGAIAALPVPDTMKRVDGTGRIVETVPRAGLWAAQTPQGFRFAAILAAHRRAAAAGRHDLTDDAAVAEWAGLTVAVVEGDADNGKLTHAVDLDRADRRLREARYLELADVRVGQGFDVHAFGPGDHVVVGGLTIPHEAALVGHSDADVGLHALTDAILGALADGDIGSHFPPSDPRWRGVDSAVFLAHACSLVAARGGVVAHLDLTLVCEAPKIGPHREAMRTRIAEIVGIAAGRVAVKATTSERLGFTGRKEGIMALATATLRLPPPDLAADEELAR